MAGGIGGTGSALGGVSQLGSVTINGVKFETNNADIFFQGQRQATKGDQSKIQLGMVVLVKGTYASTTAGDATEVSYFDDMQGRITAIDSVNGSFTAMGQTVFIDNDPVLGTHMPGLPGRLGDLKLDDIVEVSGQRDDRGNLLASFIQFKEKFSNGATAVEVKGNVAALDVTATTFKLGTLVVDYDANGGTLFKNMTIGDLPSSPLVEVKGTTFDGATGALLATEIERIDRPLNPGPGKRLEIEGLVTACVQPCSTFNVEGQRISLNGQTTFKDGSTTDLINGRKVEVEGTIDAAGVLSATKLNFVKGSVQIEALADAAADLANQTFRILDITVNVKSTTEFKGGLTLVGIAAGDQLKIKGYRTGSKQIIANEIERSNSGGGKTRLSGPLQSSAKGTALLTILGVPIQTDPQTAFFGLAHGPVSFDVFFDTTGQNAIVEVKGKESPDNAIDATAPSGGEVELRD